MKALHTIKVELDLQNPNNIESLPSLAEMKTWCDVAIQDNSYHRAFESSLSVLIRIVNNDESAELNLQYREKNGPTNVLSFPNDTSNIGFDSSLLDSNPLGNELKNELFIQNSHLGDLVICEPLVKTEAMEQSKPLVSHWAHLIIHGILHLQGFDHITDSEALEMENLEIQLLEQLGFSNPYTTEC